MSEKLYINSVINITENTQSQANRQEVNPDAELQLTESQINVIDPITKTRIVDPVRNTVCGHVYDKQSVTAMLQKNKKTRYNIVYMWRLFRIAYIHIMFSDVP